MALWLESHRSLYNTKSCYVYGLVRRFLAWTALAAHEFYNIRCGYDAAVRVASYTCRKVGKLFETVRTEGWVVQRRMLMLQGMLLENIGKCMQQLREYRRKHQWDIKHPT